MDGFQCLKCPAKKAATSDETRQFRRLLWEALREKGRCQQHSIRAPLMQRDKRATRLAALADQYTANGCATTQQLNESLPTADL